MIPIARAKEISRSVEAACNRCDVSEMEALMKGAAEARDFFGAVAHRLMEALPDPDPVAETVVTRLPTQPEETTDGKETPKEANPAP